MASWATDWRDTKMKAVLSASPFCAVATHHGGGDEKNILIANVKRVRNLIAIVESVCIIDN